MKLSQQQIQTAINSLHTAARKYEECADECARLKGHERLVEQFKVQAGDARRLAEQLEQHG